jgi:hypothetical protein
MATDLVVNIASQFLGKKAFLDADKATKKLSGSVKSLGRTLGVTLSAAALISFGKSAVKSFTGAQREAAVLANTVKNLGLAFDQTNIDQYINRIGKLYGVTGGQATPAMQALLSATGSTSKAIDIFNTALDVAAGTGADVTDVAQGLAQAYLGNTKALKKYNIGLTAAELSTSSFIELQTKLNNNFAGAATAAAATYTGQLTILAEAGNKAKEIIGESLVGAIESLGGSDGISKVATDMDNAAKSTANFIDSIIYLKDALNSIPGVGILKAIGKGLAYFPGKLSPQRAAELLKEIRGPQPFSTPMSISGQNTGAADAAARKKAELEAIKRNKELAKLAKAQAAAALATTKAKKEQAKLDKAIAAGQLALGKGEDIFDMEKIQLNAALIGQAEALGKATTGAQILAIANDVARLKVKQSINELEDAIASKDVARIEAATKQLNQDLKILGTLQSQNFTLLSIATILNSLKPKSLIDQENLDAALAKIKAMMLLLASGTATKGTTAAGSADSGGGPLFPGQPVIGKLTGNESIEAILDYSEAVTALANVMAQVQEEQNYKDFLSLVDFQKKLGDFGGYSANMNSGAGYGAGNVTVTVVDKTSGLIEVVQTAVQENNKYGNNLTYAGAI